MHPLQLAAQLAAYLWFSREKPDDPRTQQVAKRLAREHWRRFLAAADTGVGRLLVNVAQPRASRRPCVILSKLDGTVASYAPLDERSNK